MLSQVIVWTLRYWIEGSFQCHMLGNRIQDAPYGCNLTSYSDSENGA